MKLAKESQIIYSHYLKHKTLKYRMEREHR